MLAQEVAFPVPGSAWCQPVGLPHTKERFDCWQALSQFFLNTLSPDGPLVEKAAQDYWGSSRARELERCNRMAARAAKPSLRSMAMKMFSCSSVTRARWVASPNVCS